MRRSSVARPASRRRLFVDWFRSYHGAPIDPKWRLIAKNTNTTPGNVAVIWWYLLDIASQENPRGALPCVTDSRNAEIVSSAFEIDSQQVKSIINEFIRLRMIENGRITMWEKRQPKREDNSTDRVRRFRETQRNAVKRTETLDKNIREEDSKSLIKEVAYEKKKWVNGSSIYDDPANRIARRQQKVFAEITAKMTKDSAAAVIQGYIEGDPKAVKIYKEVDQSMKAREAH